jgi:hypothetical protein
LPFLEVFRIAPQPVVEAIFLPFRGDAEGDVPFESPEQVSDFHALSDAHDGVEMIRHGQGDQGGPAALFLKPRRRFEDDAPAAGVVKMVRTSVFMAERDEDGVDIAGPRRAMMRE